MKKLKINITDGQQFSTLTRHAEIYKPLREFVNHNIKTKTVNGRMLGNIQTLKIVADGDYVVEFRIRKKRENIFRWFLNLFKQKKTTSSSELLMV